MAESSQSDEVSKRLSSGKKIVFGFVALVLVVGTVARSPQFGLVDNPYYSIGMLIAVFAVLFFVYKIVEGKWGTPVEATE